ncbi:MAG: VanW family protein [Eubacterium sp.]|nr:VanW family protein [Eubacterium sp.]
MKIKVLSLITALVLVLNICSGITVFAEEKTDISAAEVLTTNAGYAYRFREIKPLVKVYIDKEGVRTQLTADTDYTFEYSDNINVGTATITVTGIGDYTGTATGTFEITPLSITSKGFKFTNTQKAAVGKEPQYTVKYKDTVLSEGTDYTVDVSGINKAGYQKATVTFTGAGNFSGEKKVKATVYPSKVTGLKGKKSGYTYKLTWNSLSSESVKGYKVYAVDKKGAVVDTLKDVSGNSTKITLEKGKVYRFKVKAYAKNSGKVVYGDLSSGVSTYTKPSRVNLNYACRSSKYKINCGWEELNCSGYQIMYSGNKKFKKAKTVFVSRKKTSKKIKVKKANKPYYVKVRAYTSYKGKKRFGKWSSKSSTEFGKLYEYYSTYYVNNPNRTTNLKLACKAIDGTIVYPGQVFSFNQTVGIRTEGKGYKPAPIFTGPTGHEDGVGGGVCQVASTMFNAALYCNFAIVERHQHSQRVVYCPLGRDAAIFWGSEDFKFRNTSKFKVKINMICADGKLTCKIYTNGYKKPPKVELKVSQSGKNFTLRRYVRGKVNYTTKSYY